MELNFSEEIQLCPEMHATAKLANLAKKRRRTGKNLNAITRGAPCKEEKFKKNLTKTLNLTKKSGKNLPRGRQIFKLDAKIGPLDSGDFN